MKVLDLFSGIGGFSLGLESTGHFRTVAFCEIDKFCKLILDKHWKGTKVYDDIKTITKKQFEEDGTEFPDIITGGFPCQPFSVAGKQQGTSDSRHLWPEMFRVIKEFAPRWVIGENVKGLTNIQDGVVFETVCSDLEGEGYEVRTFNIPAAGVQAPHRRERIWIVAHAKRFNERKSIRGSDETQSRIQEEHRQNDSTTRESSRTGSVWGTNNGYENVSNSKGERTRENNKRLWERSSRIIRGERTSGSKNVENSDNNGFERGLTETRNETIAGKESTINGIKDPDNSSRRGDGTGDHEQPRTNGAVQRLRNDDQKESTRATGIRGLHERTDISQGTAREDGHQEDDSRTLVQTGQSRVQSSISGGLERNQDPFQEFEIRQRDDSAALDRMETGRDEDMENSRRTLRSRGELQGENENEIREGNADQSQRSSGTSESNVVDSSTGRCTPQETEVQPGRYSSFDSSWWQSEPELGRVAHGVPGRVHRLKALGNSIVPKIVQEIGNAIIEAEKEKDLEILDERNGM